MSDPDEGVAADGTITTGAARERVPARYEPVLAALVEALDGGSDVVSCYLYGSVATGRARVGRSDVDLLTIGLPRSVAHQVSGTLTARFGPLCRGVEIAAAAQADLHGDGDEAYGLRVFLRHYCVHLAGPDPRLELPAFPADARAARGFNGDIGEHLARWRSEAGSQPVDWVLLGRRIARKLLLATAGLVSMRDRTWTTDRGRVAHRWAELEPVLATDLGLLLTWSDDDATADRAAVERILGTTAKRLVETFAAEIGLWS